MNYQVTIEVRVTDPEELRRAAGRSYMDETHNEDPQPLLGSYDEPNIDACLIQLLDPSTLPGGEIIETSAESF